jgi:uncharacterized surface anchored protein
MSKLTFAAVALVAAVSCPGAASAQGTVGTLTGVITDAAGSAVAGAFVQMRNAERRLNFMVTTQEQGKYSIERLPAGKYVVQAPWAARAFSWPKARERPSLKRNA